MCLLCYIHRKVSGAFSRSVHCIRHMAQICETDKEIVKGKATSIVQTYQLTICLVAHTFIYHLELSFANCVEMIQYQTNII